MEEGKAEGSKLGSRVGSLALARWRWHFWRGSVSPVALPPSTLPKSWSRGSVDLPGWLPFYPTAPHSTHEHLAAPPPHSAQHPAPGNGPPLPACLPASAASSACPALVRLVLLRKNGRALFSPCYSALLLLLSPSTIAFCLCWSGSDGNLRATVPPKVQVVPAGLVCGCLSARAALPASAQCCVV